MRRPLKRSRKVVEEVVEEEIPSGSEIDSEDMDDDDDDDDMLANVRSESDNDDSAADDDDNNDNAHEVDSDDDDDEEEEDDEEGERDDDDDDDDEEEEEEGDEEDEGEGKERQLNEEMEQLDKEYMQLQKQEQDLLKNLKRHKDEDILKGQAVKNQKALWDKTLEFRFLLQKPFSSCNRLPQEPLRSLFQTSGDGVSDAYSDLINSSKKTLDTMLELQEALLEKNPAIAQSADVTSAKNSKHIEGASDSNGEGDEEWSKISQMQSRMASFRDKAIDKWHRKTQVTTGAAAIKSKLQAFNQNISEQVNAYMRDPSKMIKGMQQNRSAIALFGTVPDSPDKQEVVNAESDPELLDDAEFYQQLLKEFFETIDPASSETAFYAIKRLQTKKRKIVDRRASKSRKIRYNVHEKIVNFMAPQPMDQPDMAPKLFQNLFGLRSQNQPQQA